METTISGRLRPSPNRTLLHSKSSGDKYSLHKQSTKWITVMTMAPPRLEKGGGVMDKPVIEKTTPGRESEFDLKKSRKMAPPYRVMLHNDNFNKREYVVQVLMKVIPGMTVDNAVNIMQEAHVNDLSVVIVCGQPDAEEHCTQLRGNGLLSSIEPDSGGC
ncbi:ATP-dependent Clp protease adapter protein CLPS1, chloroplastic-like [Bidens hawaiensis]|uniref:ATP-dependent Clp protease adapter protein CLPS1, chloroplastic-like n=1 Tax=Bidens hawaiensis TaxID=980011 RepID=UPI00404A722F